MTNHESFDENLQQLNSTIENTENDLANLEQPKSLDALTAARQNIELWRSEIAQNMDKLCEAETLIASESSPDGVLIIGKIVEESKAKTKSLINELDIKDAEFAAHADAAKKAEHLTKIISNLIHTDIETVKSLKSEALEVQIDRLKACEAELLQNPAIVEFNQLLESVEVVPEIKEKMVEVQAKLVDAQTELQDKLSSTETKVQQTNKVDEALKSAQELKESTELNELKPIEADSCEVLKQKLAQVEDQIIRIGAVNEQLNEVSPLIESIPEKEPEFQQINTTIHEHQQRLIALKEEIGTQLDELDKIEALSTEIANELEQLAPQLESIKQPKASLEEKREVLSRATQLQDELKQYEPQVMQLKQLQGEQANKSVEQFENIAGQLQVSEIGINGFFVLYKMHDIQSLQVS